MALGPNGTQEKVQDGKISRSPQLHPTLTPSSTSQPPVSAFLPASSSAFRPVQIYRRKALDLLKSIVHAVFGQLPLAKYLTATVPHSISTVASIRRSRDIYQGESRTRENFVSIISLLYS